MITPKKPMKKIYIVKALPGDGRLMSNGATNKYDTKGQACRVAESLAVKERRRFVVFEAVACYDVAAAVEVPIIDVEDHPAPIDCDIDDCEVCESEPWHEDGVFCDDPKCPTCPEDCRDGMCGDCRPCRIGRNQHHKALRARKVENCEDTLCHWCHPTRES